VNCEFIIQHTVPFAILWSSALGQYKIQASALAWIRLSSVLRPLHHSIGYMGDGFYRSKDPTNTIKVLKGHI